MFQKIYQKLQTREGVMLMVSLALGVAIIIAVLGLIFGGHHGPRYSDAGGQEATIAVTGNGEAFAVPDVAQFTFTINKDAKTMAEAQKQVSELGNVLINKLESAGINKKDIKTEGFNAYPKYENRAVSTSMMPCSPTYCPPTETNSVIVGYTVSHTYSVKVRNLDKASDIAKLLTDVGVSSISGPDFTVDNIDSIRNDARSQAIVDAKVQAKILAGQLGVKLGKIVDFQVINNGGYPVPMYARAVSSDAVAGEKAVAPALEPGQTDVKVQVQVTYEIK